MENLIKKDKYRRNINRFLALGGVSAIVGIIATSPILSSNVTAENIGLYAAIMAAVGIAGAAWNWASLEDLKAGKTASVDIKNLKQNVVKAFSRIRKEFDDEFATNQGLEEKDVPAVKKRVSPK